MIKKMGHLPKLRTFSKKLRSVIVAQNHYINHILDVHPLVSARACVCVCAWMQVTNAVDLSVAHGHIYGASVTASPGTDQCSPKLLQFCAVFLALR